MILIAESGSTKTNWVALNSGGNHLLFDTEGYNPFFVDAQYIKNSISKTISQILRPEEISDIFFYGAGCMGEKTRIVEDAMEQIFPNASVYVYVDLLAAARAVLGNNSGFCAILGTGTNSCLYNGREITHNIDSLGFLIGDEGSGSAIGKRLLRDYARGYMPRNIAIEFHDQYQMEPDEVTHRIFKAPLANRYCGAFSKFITKKSYKNAYLNDLVKTCFREFFENLVMHYPDIHQYTFNCVGSVGYTFQEILNEVSLEYKMKPGNIIQSPLKGLMQYHEELALVKGSKP